MKTKIYILFLLSILFGTALSPRAYAADATEYKLKAVFIYNFIKFVTWPEKDESKSESVKIAIIGDDPFGNSFDSITKKTIGDKAIEVVRHRTYDEIADSNSMGQYRVVFICESESQNAAKIIASVAGKPVLVVSDINDFTDQGGMMGFVEKDNKIRFEININAVKLTDLKISSQLLKLALRVIEKQQYSKGY